MHANLEAGSAIQSAYKKRVDAGLDPGDKPSEAGLLSVQQMMKAYLMFQYKAVLDQALLDGRFDSIRHKVFTLAEQRPAVAVSALFSLDGIHKEDGTWVNVFLNVLPITARETVVVFSYLVEDELQVGCQLNRVFSAGGAYQKYEISKLILNYCENVVVAPEHFDSWPKDKVEAITNYFLSTMFKGDLSVDDERFYLF